eukprot:g11000.t1
MPRRVVLLLLTGSPAARGAVPPRDASKALLGQRRIAELGSGDGVELDSSSSLKSDGFEGRRSSDRDDAVEGRSADRVSTKRKPRFSASAAMETAEAAEAATATEHTESETEQEQEDGGGDDDKDPCSPYNLMSEANVRNFLDNFKAAEDKDGKTSTRHGSSAHDHYSSKIKVHC